MYTRVNRVNRNIMYTRVNRVNRNIRIQTLSARTKKEQVPT
jgi:hypothetical protein